MPPCFIIICLGDLFDLNRIIDLGQLALGFAGSQGSQGRRGTHNEVHEFIETLSQGLVLSACGSLVGLRTRMVPMMRIDSCS